MKVLHLGTDDYAGGAARAMYRWHASLRKIGVDSKILCLNKSSDDPEATAVHPNWEKQSTFEYGILQRFFIELNRTTFSDTFFSHPLGYTSIADHELIQQAEVIHVHWTSLFFHWQELRRIKALGKRVVLTPHDLWAITGGCHYPGSCDGYLKACLDCPMLQQDPSQLVSASRAVKQKVISESVDIILSPSHWMDETFRGVEAIKNVTKLVIPYCIDLERFTIKSKKRAKDELKFESGRRLVLFCANNVTEGRKGLEQFTGVLKICEDRTEFRKVLEENVDFVLIGKGSDSVQIPTVFRTHGRGYVETTVDLGRYYSAADLMIYLGLEDNLPNVILEAMACGMPVLAFNTGGVGDLVSDGETGELVERGDRESFAARMVALLADPERLSEMGRQAHEKVLQEFSDVGIGWRLLQLYTNLHQEPAKPAAENVNGIEDLVFDRAVVAATRAAMVKGYRSLEQESDSLRPHLSKQEDEIRILRGFLNQLPLDTINQSEKHEEEIRALRGYLAKQDEEIRMLRAHLEQLPLGSERQLIKQEEEIGTLRGLLEKQEEETQKLQGYLDRLSSDSESQSARQQEEIRKLQTYLEQLSQAMHKLSACLEEERQSVRDLSAELDQERQKTLLSRLGEKLSRLSKIGRR